MAVKKIETAPTIKKTVILALVAPLSVFMGVVVFNNVIVTFFLFHIIVCLLIPLFDLVIFGGKALSVALEYLGFKNFNRGIIPGISLGLIYSVSIFLFFAFFNSFIMDAAQIRDLLTVWNVDSLNIVLFLFFMIFANSIFEEVYWRGYIFCSLKSIIATRTVIFFTSLCYSSYHLITTLYIFPVIYSLLFTLIVFTAGMIWGYLRDRYDSLAAPVISHLMADLSIMLVYVVYIR
jgi:membrane protease YdiL (CAAX protease family)